MHGMQATMWIPGWSDAYWTSMRTCISDSHWRHAYISWLLPDYQDATRPSEQRQASASSLPTIYMTTFPCLSFLPSLLQNVYTCPGVWYLILLSVFYSFVQSCTVVAVQLPNAGLFILTSETKLLLLYVST